MFNRARNLAAALTNSTWTALVGLAVVPIYLKLLGVEAYGLIGVFSTLQALLQVLDLGFSPTINREIARSSTLGDNSQVKVLLHTLAVVTAVVAVLIAVLMFALAPAIATGWLKGSRLEAKSLSHSIILMGMVLACRWPIGLFQGALVGMQRLGTSSKINIVMVTLGSLGAVAVLAFVSATIEAFFVWQALVALLHVGLMRAAAWRALGGRGSASFDLTSLVQVWRFSLLMSGVTISALVLSQLDKILLSKLLPLEDFGIYVLATTVVGSLYVIVSPVFNVIYPLFSSLVAQGDVTQLAEAYRNGTRALANVLFPVAAILVIVPLSLVKLWTGDPAIAARVSPLIAMMAVGTALHGIMYFPYSLQLSYGMPRLALTINIFLMLILVPLTYQLTTRLGVFGGALAWLLFHVIYLLFGTWLTGRHLLRHITSRWMIMDVGAPLAITALVGALGYLAIQRLGGTSDVGRIALAGLTALAAFTATALLAPVSLPWIRTTFFARTGAST